MTGKMKIALIVLVVLVVLGMIGSALGFNQIKEERRLRQEEVASHARTQQALSKTAKALSVAEATALDQKTAARNPDGTIALDGHGNPIFETLHKSSSRASSSSEAAAFASASTVSGTTKSIHEESEIIQKPAATRGAYVAWNPFKQTDLGLVYTQAVFGPIGAGAMVRSDLATLGDFSQIDASVYILAGIRF